jgi:putative transposase
MRRGLIEPGDPELSVRKQCALLRVTRSNVYYESVADDAEDRELMRMIDEIHLDLPFYGSRSIATVLRTAGHPVNRKRIQRLMRKMGIESIAPKPNTSRPAPEHTVFPYLLRTLKIERVNQVWATDITYIPMARGFGYLVAIIDWHSRRVLAWRLSNTMDTRFCVEALEEALEKFDAPDILNTDQGAQFTAAEFTKVVLGHGIKLSMDGRGRWVDNVFVERLWRSLKYEEVYLHAYDNLDEARRGIGAYFDFYNTERPHRALGSQTPAAFYDLLIRKAA